MKKHLLMTIALALMAIGTTAQSIDFYTQSKMRCRVDCMDIKASSTGIGNVILPDALDQHAPIYDLSGRRIPSTNPRPGIYILRGKKFVVK
jgi:hypothetical protein